MNFNILKAFINEIITWNSNLKKFKNENQLNFGFRLVFKFEPFSCGYQLENPFKRQVLILVGMIIHPMHLMEFIRIQTCVMLIFTVTMALNQLITFARTDFFSMAKPVTSR